MTIFFVHFGGHISKIYNLSCIEVTKHHLEQNVEFHSICYQTQIIYKGHKKIENEFSIMKIHEQAVVLVFVLAVVEILEVSSTRHGAELVWFPRIPLC